MTNNLEVVKRVFDVITFNVTDAVIAQMDEKCLNLKINGPTDKKGFEAVHEARMFYKNSRVSVEKTGVELRKKAKASIEDYLEAEKKEESRILKLLEPGEERLTEEEKSYIDAMEAIKQEKIKQEEARIQARRDRLLTFGMGLFGMNYRLPFDAPGSEVPEPLLKVCSDEQFEQFCGKIQEAIDTEQARLLEIEKARLAEEKRVAEVAAAQEAERKRLDRIAREQEAKEEAARKAQEEAERKLREEREAIVREQAEREAKIKAEQEAVDAEKKRLADTEAARLKAIEDEKVRAENEKKRQAELEQARKEAAEKALRDAEEKAKLEAKAKVDKEDRDRIAAEKKAARRPDKAKILLVADMLDAIQTPDVKTDDGKAVALAIMMDIQTLIKSIRDKVEAL